MNPADRLARSLTILGVAGLVYFYFLAHSAFGTALALCLLVGSGSVQYTDGKPYLIPYLVGMLALVGLLQIFRGQLPAVLLGSLLGMGLPYMMFRLRSVQKP